MIVMTQSGWSEEYPLAHQASLLGESQAERESMSRTRFFDLFDLNVTDSQEGYSATALYHVYLRSRARARTLGLSQSRE
ncbi:hypothetical protein [Nonomuraea sp. B19D2]|uniref:hypothetical protein n=1 Tax=Nonomuraea sp. B19D2 TaxID=3159561 RepID=UPI0032D9D92E